MLDCISAVFALVGAIVVLRILYRFLAFVYAYAIRPATNVWAKYGSAGSWAVVTGASDGIGYEYTRQLAEAGFNVVMVARNRGKLAERRDHILADLKRQPKPELRIAVVDYNQDYSVAQYKELDEETRGKEIAILVNNVGAGNARHYDVYPLDKLQEMVRVNSYSFAFTTRMILPQILHRAQALKRRSAVITVSSAIVLNYWAYAVIYGATKTFLLSEMNSLAMEYEGQGIDFMTCIPGEVLTNLNWDSGFGAITAEACTRGQLRFLGYDQVTCGALLHKILLSIPLPESYWALSGKRTSEMYEQKWGMATTGAAGKETKGVAEEAASDKTQ